MPANPAPFSARPLSSGELLREDIYLTRSPSSGAIIQLVSPVRLAQWLLFEFDPTISACVERPRTVELDTERTGEIDFWTQGRDGSETFWLLVGNEQTIRTQSGVSFRGASLWLPAAQRAGFNLKFVYEYELLRQSQRIANCFRMLSHVQAARALPNLLEIERSILSLFNIAIQHLTPMQMQSGLKHIDQHEVLAAIQSLVHRGRLSVDWSRPITLTSSFSKETAHV